MTTHQHRDPGTDPINASLEERLSLVQQMLDQAAAELGRVVTQLKVTTSPTAGGTNDRPRR